MKKHAAALTLGIVAVCAMLIARPQVYIESVRAGLMLFTNNVLPALFPFFIITRMLTLSGGADALSRVFAKPVQSIFLLPPAAGTAFFLSAVSGYPVGSKVTADYCKQGLIPKAYALRVSVLCSTSGPFFVIGTAGALMFGNPQTGYLLLGCHLAAALLCALIICRLAPRPKQEKSAVPLAHAPYAPLPPTGRGRSQNPLADSVYDSVVSLALVGAYITLFYMLADMLVLSHVLAPVKSLLALTGMTADVADAYVLGFFEVTRGCKAAAAAGGYAGIIAAGGVIGFGGLCVNLQSLAFLQECGVRTTSFLACKLLHGAIAAALTFVACVIFL